MGVIRGANVLQEMSAEYKGKEVVASVAEVVPLHRKLMLSIINGEQNLELRKLHVRPAAPRPLPLRDGQKHAEALRVVSSGMTCLSDI